MDVSKDRAVSLWINIKVRPARRALRGDETANIAVIGFGPAGLSAACPTAAPLLTVLLNE